MHLVTQKLVLMVSLPEDTIVAKSKKKKKQKQAGTRQATHWQLSSDVSLSSKLHTHWQLHKLLCTLQT